MKRIMSAALACALAVSIGAGASSAAGYSTDYCPNGENICTTPQFG